MDWTTDEDLVDTDRAINPMLVKYSASNLAANIPQQFQRLNLCNLSDCKFIVATCFEALRAMSLHNKISTANEWGHKKNPADLKSTPFEIFNVGDCRRVMLQLTSNSLTEEQNAQLVNSRMEHLKNCKPCFSLFNRHAYFTCADFTFVGILLYEVEKGTFSAKWFTDRQGNEYYLTEDVMGASKDYSDRPGTCIRALTGGAKLQGRVSSKVYVTSFVVMDPSTPKKASYMMIFDIKKVHKDKVKLFANVYNKYFEKIIWSKTGKANNYLKELGESVFKVIDVVSNVMNSYCYNPTEGLVASLKRGLDPFYVTDDRLEISPHYEASKSKAKFGYSFCTECSEPSCALNKAMCIVFQTVAEMIEKFSQFEASKRIKLSMLDFFREDEIEHFLTKFTGKD